jgi:hypothetical protein
MEEEQHHLSAPLALSDSWALLLRLLLRVSKQRLRRHERNVVLHSLSAAICVYCAYCSVHAPTQLHSTPNLLLHLNLFYSAAAAARQPLKSTLLQRAR